MDPMPEIEPGDFVRHKQNGFVCGFAVAHGRIEAGALLIPGWVVRLARGQMEFVTDDDIELICKGDDEEVD